MKPITNPVVQLILEDKEKARVVIAEDINRILAIISKDPSTIEEFLEAEKALDTDSVFQEGIDPEKAAELDKKFHNTSFGKVAGNFLLSNPSNDISRLAESFLQLSIKASNLQLGINPFDIPFDYLCGILTQNYQTYRDSELTETIPAIITDNLGFSGAHAGALDIHLDSKTINIYGKELKVKEGKDKRAIPTPAVVDGENYYGYLGQISRLRYDEQTAFLHKRLKFMALDPLYFKDPRNPGHFECNPTKKNPKIEVIPISLPDPNDERQIVEVTSVIGYRFRIPANWKILDQMHKKEY